MTTPRPAHELPHELLEHERRTGTHHSEPRAVYAEQQRPSGEGLVRAWRVSGPGVRFVFAGASWEPVMDATVFGTWLADEDPLRIQHWITALALEHRPDVEAEDVPAAPPRAWKRSTS